MAIDPRPPLHSATESVDGQLNTAFRSAVHDLRSPLQSLFSSIDALEPQHLDPAGQQALQRIRRSTQTLGTQMDDLVVLLLIQSRTLVPAPVSFEVGALLEELKEVAAFVASDRGPRVATMQPSRPIFAFADAALIRQALARILRVLTKVTVQGEVRLSVEAPSPVLPMLTFCAQTVLRKCLTEEIKARLLLVRMIASSLGGHLAYRQETGGDVRIVFTVPVQLEDPDAIPVARR